MKIFLDSNIFIDMLVPRENSEDNMNAAKLLKLSALEDFDFFVSPITVSVGFYVTRKDTGAVEKIHSRLQNMSVLPMDSSDVRFALESELPDKEDAMQMSCADRAGCELIITRDSRHFQNSPLPVMSPATFLSRLV